MSGPAPVLFPAFKLFLPSFLVAAFWITAQAQTVSFTLSNLSGETLSNPTSLDFGPDGRLYVAQQNGVIVIYTVVKNAPNNYAVTSTEVINLIQQIPNHNDQGVPQPTVNTRQVTGILVTGTPQNPVIYVTSSDPRIGGGFNANNLNLDTNSGVISRLTWNGTQWVKVDLVRGLPRSEENHSLNGMALDAVNNFLYVAQGSNTNMGAPSNNFLKTPEYAYSTAILQVDLNAIGNSTYDLPTLDDEDRTNVNSVQGFEDINDPFGGNNGKNQAVLVPGGPVQIYAPGFRNNYDIVISKLGKMYSFDNGPNAGWGGPPIGCSNQQSEPGVTYCDVLLRIDGPGLYFGHPNPTRANRANKFNPTNPQSPIPLGMENPAECTYIPEGSRPGEIESLCSSTNGLCEYTASNFSGAMKGNLIAAAFNGKLYRFKLTPDGNAVVPGGQTVLASNFGSTPLDVIAQGDNEIFPGTIWCITYGSGNVTILEPADAPSCLGDPNSVIQDSDGDGYKNNDETLNGTDWCSPSSKPQDFDGDFISDLLDPDDDNDGINDINDKFALDYYNGMNTQIPISLDFDNTENGGINNWGFTGLMINNVSNYQNLFNPVGMTVGGAALKFTVDAVSEGEAFAAGNNQQNAFQFGVNISNPQWSYIVQSRVMGPFQGFTPLNYQTMGMFIGTGDQDNFLRIVCHANNGAGGIQVLKEVAGVPVGTVYNAPILNKDYVDFFFHINPSTLMVQPSYSVNGAPPITIGPAISVPANWISPNALAVGIISSSFGPAEPFPATWDFVKVYYDQSTVTGQWHTINSATLPSARHECAYVQAGEKFYLLGGRGIKPVQCYHPADNSWSNRAAPPVQIHHFQGIEYNGLIYAVCGFTGNFPNETPLSHIYIYDPLGDKWTVGPEIPVTRRRGSAGCVMYNNKFYIVCGITNGHIDGWVPWLDVYDPINNTWQQLPDAPRERDHFNVALVDDKIYCIGGRKTGFGGSTFNATVPQVDIYDISDGIWRTLPSPSGDLPTPRAAAAVAVLGNEILVIGGESGSQTSAHNKTEALNFINETWREVASLNQGRHGTQAIVSNGNIYVAAGSKIRGNDEINSHEVFYFFKPTQPTGTVITKGNLAPSTTAKNFSMVLLSDTKTSTINLSNTGGNQVLIVNELTLSDTVNYKLTNVLNLPISVAPGIPFPLQIEFRPLSLGMKNATIHIEHTGANGPIDITLTGESVLTIPCQQYATEINGLLVFEAESVPPVPQWNFSTATTTTAANGATITVGPYLGTGYISFDGPHFLNTPGNGLMTYTFNIQHPGRYRFHYRSFSTYPASSNLNFHANDVWVRWPHGGARKFESGYDKGALLGWIKVSQNRHNVWNYETGAVTENHGIPYDIYVDFPYAGTYTMDISGRSGTFKLDRFVYFNENILTLAQATTDNPPPSPVQCIEVAWFADNDGDLFGNPNDYVLSLVKPAGYVLNNRDCNDTKASVNPGHVEIEDGLDNNCNGVVDEGFGNPKALFVVGNTILSPADQFVKDRIMRAGFEVTVMSAPQATTLAGTAMNLIFISSTVNSADVGEKFTYLQVPVIVCEPLLFDDFKMMSGNAANLGTLTNQTQIKLVGAPHPLVADLPNGVKTIYTSLDKITWGKPVSSARIIARNIIDTTQCAIFAFDNNTLMTSINAPARRVGFFLNDDGAAKLTADGLALLDAAIRWTANYTNINAKIGDALFVVGSTTLTNADLFIKTRLEGLGFNVFPVAGTASKTTDATGKELIVISSTINSTDVNTKFTNVAVPLMNWEPALSDDLKLTSTGATTATSATKIMIMNTSHSMAAGLPPATQVVVYNSPGNIIHSSSAGSNAIKIACTGSSTGGVNNNITIFGYEKGVTMVGATAPERRVGFFLHDLGASLLNANGWSLFDAAIRWLTEGLNTPPAFNLSGSITVNEDFIGTQTVFVNPLPVPPGEQNQVPIYSLSPASVSFANVSFSSATGNVTFTSKPNEFGTQEFTITADDHQIKNNTYSKTFTFTVNPVNDPPAFNISGNITALKNFAGIRTVTVTPDPVPPNEANQTVTYSLYPASVPFANVSINNSTGQVSVTAIPDQTGFQIFTLTANDGQTAFNTASKQFYLAVNNPTSNALCFNCGGPQYVSVTGDTFRADYYFSGGTLTYTNNNIQDIQNTFDDFFYITERNAAAFSYNIPVANGVYKVRLYFAETYFGATGGSATGGAGSRVFHVNIENIQLLSYFDIFAQAGGAEKAIVREFSNVAVSDGMMNIAFNAVINKAKISGICVVPDASANTPPSFTLSGNIAVEKNFSGTRSVIVTPDPVPPDEAGQLVIYTLSPPTVPFANISFNSSTGRVDVTSQPDAYGFQAFTITANDGQAVNNTVSKTFYLAVNETRSKALCWNCGGPQYVSVVGDTFRSDFYFTSGAFTSTNNAIVDIQNTFDDFIYRSERNSPSFGYNIPVANGLYKVKLLFAETYFGATGGSTSGGIGSRVFNVTLEGTQVLTNYDIFFKAGGAERAIIEEFDSLQIKDGFINIYLTALVNKAKISGICVIPYTDNNPPTFSLSTNTLTLPEDFTTTQTVTVIPDPVPPADAGEVVRYSLSPAGTGVASVSINPATGTITVNKLPNKNGTQVFSVTADDGKPFGTFSRTFTLTVTPVNDPPTFTLNNNIVLAKNFSPPVSVQVIPDAVPADESSQIVTYTLSPPSVPFATISFNTSTGQVTFTSIFNAYGSQQFTIFADDGQPVNNLASQTFTLTVNQLGPNEPRPLFINCGSSTQFISLAGDTFKADNYFSSPSFTFTNNSIPDILNTGDDAIYRTERYAGTFSYNIPVNNGLYDISLHFAELYYGATGGQLSNGGPGKRLFNVLLEGVQVLTNYDIWVAAGGAERAVIQTFKNIQITDGQVNLTFIASVNNAKVNAISIKPVSVDCAGVQGGLAIVNPCNVCVGGTTGLALDAGKDCAGVCGGSAYLNSCNICVGGTTGLSENQGKDCAGVCSGTAFLDDCNICSGGTSGHMANSNKDVCGVCFGNGSTCTPPCVANEVVSFTLVRAGTAGDIGPLTNGMTINLATIGSFSIRANTCNGLNVGSVKFIVNGSTVKTESTAPYAINGDSPVGYYTPWNPSTGAKTLTATPYSGSGGTGTAGVSKTVAFTIINQAGTPDCAGVIGGTATINSCGICVGGTTGLPLNQGKDCAGVCNGAAFLDDCGICSGGTSGHVANSDKDACGVCFGNNSSCAPCVPNQVSSLTLVREGTAGEIGLFNENAVINLAAIGSFSVRADVCPGSTVVKSIKFVLNGETIRTESAPPYAINGDSPAGNYIKWTPPTGSHTLVVTPYTGTGGTGTAGVPLIRHFTVTNAAGKAEPHEIHAGTDSRMTLTLYPNPNNGYFNVKYYMTERRDVQIRIFNQLGQVIYSEIKSQSAGEATEQISLVGQPAGIYLLQLLCAEEQLNEKIIIRD